MNNHSEKAIQLLKQLIATPSFSKEEDKTAALLSEFLQGEGISFQRFGNNIIAKNKYFNAEKKSILLNSHHDTVRPGTSWTKDPFNPLIEDGKIFGLGSNDAGGSLVALIATFLHFHSQKDLPFNIILAATAEEEISGKGGIESIISQLGNIELAIVGEPTQMQLAIAEKGLLVIDCIAHGKTGHAAREEGENAIYKAMKDIEWFRTFEFVQESELLGKVKMNVTTINAGKQHNVIPDQCVFTVDIRVTDCYSHEEILDIIRKNISSEVTPRSTRLRASRLPVVAFSAKKGNPHHHAIHYVAKELGIKTFGSSTLSDMALMPFPAVKIGPGDSARSHSADEFIFLKEIEQGVETYIALINMYHQKPTNNDSHIRAISNSYPI